jgi:pyruvate kinase
MIHAGVDVVRINFSHGAPQEHRARAERVRRLSEAHNRCVGILGDLQGPRSASPASPRGWSGCTAAIVSSWTPGWVRTRATDAGWGSPTPDLPKDVRPGDQLLLDDGRLGLEVEQGWHTTRSTAGWWSVAS